METLKNILYFRRKLLSWKNEKTTPKNVLYFRKYKLLALKNLDKSSLGETGCLKNH